MLLLPAHHSPGLVSSSPFFCKDCLWTAYTSSQLIHTELFSLIEICLKAMNLCNWKDQRPRGQIILSIISVNVLFTIANTQNPNFIVDKKFGISCLDRCKCLDQTARAHLLQGKTVSLLSPK